MCDFITPTVLAITAAAISAAGTTAATVGQQQQAASQANFQQQQGEAANANAINQFGQIQRRLTEEEAAASLSTQETNIEAAQARARAKVAASAAGVSGLSVDNLIGDIFNQEGRRTSAINTNLEFTQAALADQASSIFAGAQSAVNTSLRPVQAPGFATAALQIGADSLNAYNTYFPQPPTP